MVKISLFFFKFFVGRLVGTRTGALLTGSRRTTTGLATLSAGAGRLRWTLAGLARLTGAGL